MHVIGITFERYSGLYLWAAFIAIFSIWVPSLFLTGETIHTIASTSVVPAILAMAVLIPMAAGSFDVSVGAMSNMCAILVVVLQNVEHLNMFAAIIVTLIVSAAIGTFNGFMVVKMRINSFIVTLGVATILSAAQTIISGNAQPAAITTSSWLNLTSAYVFGFQVIIIYMIVLALLIWWLLEHTPMGRYIYAIGSNAEAARLSGVNVGKWQWLTLIMSATVAGISGVLYASLNGPSLTYGPALLLPAFAAVFLGSTQVRPGRPNLWGTMLAVFLLATGVYGLQLVTGVQWLNEMFSGVALIVAVGFASWRQMRSSGERLGGGLKFMRVVKRPGQNSPLSAAGDSRGEEVGATRAYEATDRGETMPVV